MNRKKRSISIIGVPLDLGQSRRGVDMGPAALRYAGLSDRLRAIGWDVKDCGNVEIPVRDELPEGGGFEYLPAVVRACDGVFAAGRAAIEDDCLPIFLGGDHSIALGTVSATATTGRVGVIWVDAHGDFNTPQTSPTGNIHGMPLAALTGTGAPEMVDFNAPGAKIDPKNLVLIGIRSLDTEERETLRGSGATVYTMREIDENGIGDIANRAIAQLADCDRVHVSLDMDSLDPREAPGVGTPVTGGLTFREAHLLMEKLSAGIRIDSVDIVEVNPILDRENRTASIGVDLVASLLGQTIF